MQRALALLTFASIVAISSSASANGRFPEANQLVFGANGDLAVRTTFGLLVSHDRARFDYVCEAAVGYGGVQDPGIGLFGDGSIAVAAFEGLAVTHDGGCTWAFASEDGLAKQYVIDDAIERGDPSRGVVITSTGTKQGFYDQLFRTTDAGRTWTAVGDPLPSDILVETLDVAPSDPSRIYVSGTSMASGGLAGVFLTSKDGGTTWTRSTVDLVGDEDVFIGAVDPTDPDRVYVRTHGQMNDRLLVSKDGGATFAEATKLAEAMLGLAVSPDGARVAIGGKTSGLRTASRDDLAFAQAGKSIAVSCLAWDANGLWACADGFVDGFEIGTTSDEGATWTPVLKALADIGGPIASCPQSFHDTCDAPWASLAQSFAPGAGGAPSANGELMPAPPEQTQSQSSGCATSGARAPSVFGWLAALGIVVAARARKRR